MNIDWDWIVMGLGLFCLLYYKYQDIRRIGKW